MKQKHVTWISVLAVLVLLVFSMGCPLETNTADTIEEVTQFTISTASGARSGGGTTLNNDEDVEKVTVKVFKASTREWLPTTGTGGVSTLTKTQDGYAGSITMVTPIAPSDGDIIFFLWAESAAGEHLYTGTAGWNHDAASTIITIQHGSGYNGEQAMTKGSATADPAYFGYGPYAGIGPSGGYVYFDKKYATYTNAGDFPGYAGFDNRVISYVGYSTDPAVYDGDKYTIGEELAVEDGGFKWRYLEAAPLGWDSNLGEVTTNRYQWGGRNIPTGITALDMGYGAKNTADIIAFWDDWRAERIANPTNADPTEEGDPPKWVRHSTDTRNYTGVVETRLELGQIPSVWSGGTEPDTWTWLTTYAALAADGYNTNSDNNNGLGDWFLPAYDDLQPIWWNLVSDRVSGSNGRGAPTLKDSANVNLSEIGKFYVVRVVNFVDVLWASAEDSAHSAAYQTYATATRLLTYAKNNEVGVRPVRGF